MKKTFQLPLLVLAVSLSVAACKGNKSGSSADTSKSDSSTSVKSSTDTTIKLDTVKPATDTSAAKVDTVSKMVIKKTESKRTVVKKEVH